MDRLRHKAVCHPSLPSGNSATNGRRVKRRPTSTATDPEPPSKNLRQAFVPSSHPLYRDGVCFWLSCSATYGSVEAFLRHLLEAHHSKHQAALQISEQQRIALTEMERLCAMKLHYEELCREPEVTNGSCTPPSSDILLPISGRMRRSIKQRTSRKAAASKSDTTAVTRQHEDAGWQIVPVDDTRCQMTEPACSSTDPIEVHGCGIVSGKHVGCEIVSENNAGCSVKSKDDAECLIMSEEDTECSIKPMDDFGWSVKLKDDPVEHVGCWIVPEDESICQIVLEGNAGCSIKSKDNAGCLTGPEDDDRCSVKPKNDIGYRIENDDKCLIKQNDDVGCLVKSKDDVGCSIKPIDDFGWSVKSKDDVECQANPVEYDGCWIMSVDDTKCQIMLGENDPILSEDNSRCQIVSEDNALAPIMSEEDSRCQIVLEDNALAPIMSENNSKCQSLSENNALAPVILEDDSRCQIVSEDNAGAPIMLEDDSCCPIVSEDNALAPIISEDDSCCPIVSEDNALAPIMLEDDSKCQVVSEDNAGAPIMLEDDSKCQIVSEDNAGAPIMSEDNSRCYIIQEDVAECELVSEADSECPADRLDAAICHLAMLASSLPPPPPPLPPPPPANTETDCTGLPSPGVSYGDCNGSATNEFNMPESSSSSIAVPPICPFEDNDPAAAEASAIECLEEGAAMPCSATKLADSLQQKANKRSTVDGIDPTSERSPKCLRMTSPLVQVDEEPPLEVESECLAESDEESDPNSESDYEPPDSPFRPNPILQSGEQKKKKKRQKKPTKKISTDLNLQAGQQKEKRQKRPINNISTGKVRRSFRKLEVKQTEQAVDTQQAADTPNDSCITVSNREFYRNSPDPPPFPIKALIRQSIVESEDKMLSTIKIRAWLKENFLYYRQLKPKQGVNIENVLQKTKCFVKVESSAGSSVVKWSVDEALYQQLRLNLYRYTVSYVTPKPLHPSTTDVQSPLVGERSVASDSTSDMEAVKFAEKDSRLSAEETSRESVKGDN